MASLFRDRRSPYWYLRYRDLDGRWKLKATPFRIGVGTETAKARELVAEHTLAERRDRGTKPREIWSAWVPDFLATRSQAPKTRQRYEGAWFHVARFLQEQRITSARAVTFAHCRSYLDWRTAQKLRRRKCVSLNTALFEVKVLGLILAEAMRRGYAAGNPCRNLGVAREKTREKPALTDEQIGQVREALRTRPDWMRHAFELALHHGCRLSECRVAMSDVDLTSGVIYFRRTKGDKPFVVPIHPGIRPLIAERIAAKGRFLADVPASNASKLFHQFFRRIGLEGISFHCTRVTVATWLARNPAVPEKQAMHYLNHASETIHRAYQRWRPHDVSAVVAAVCPPPASSENPSGSPASPGRSGRSSSSRG